MKIFLTGADGFIGSHLAELLVKKGFNVKALTYYNSFNSWGWLDHINQKVRKDIEIITGDIRDEQLISNTIKKKIDVVINLAALIGIPYSYRAPKSYIDTNVYGLMNILNSARKSNIEKIIHTSTSEVYGNPVFIPITEEHPVSGQSPYAASKIAADQIALSYEKSFKLPITILRPFNTFGPRQSARAVIPTIISQILKQGKIELGSLFPTRDFTYVEDTAEAFIKSIKNKKNIGEVINIGSGFEISIKDLVKKIAKLMGKSVSVSKSLRRVRPKKSEVLRLCASTKKAKKLINWSPKFTGKNGFNEGLKKTISWFSMRENLKIYKANIYND
jgi:NAD dependent epimerase/dehydratase